jgi:hypothetical protein
VLPEKEITYREDLEVDSKVILISQPRNWLQASGPFSRGERRK